MEMLSVLLGLCVGVYQSLVDSPRKGPVLLNFDIALVASWQVELKIKKITYK